MQIVLLSGSVSSGKTTLSSELHHQFGLEVLKTKEVIKNLARKKLARELEADRRTMQLFGERLDRQTDGKWVCDALTKLLRSPNQRVVVDAVRIQKQIRAIRQAYGFAVIHIHLKAPEGVLANRYRTRKGTGFHELKSYSDVERNPTEARISDLEAAADVVMSRLSWKWRKAFFR